MAHERAALEAIHIRREETAVVVHVFGVGVVVAGVAEELHQIRSGGIDDELDVNDRTVRVVIIPNDVQNPRRCLIVVPLVSERNAFTDHEAVGYVAVQEDRVRQDRVAGRSVAADPDPVERVAGDRVLDGRHRLRGCVPADHQVRATHENPVAHVGRLVAIVANRVGRKRRAGVAAGREVHAVAAIARHGEAGEERVRRSAEERDAIAGETRN